MRRRRSCTRRRRRRSHEGDVCDTQRYVTGFQREQVVVKMRECSKSFPDPGLEPGTSTPYGPVSALQASSGDSGRVTTTPVWVENFVELKWTIRSRWGNGRAHSRRPTLALPTAVRRCLHCFFIWNGPGGQYASLVIIWENT